MFKLVVYDYLYIFENNVYILFFVFKIIIFMYYYWEKILEVIILYIGELY